MMHSADTQHTGWRGGRPASHNNDFRNSNRDWSNANNDAWKYSRWGPGFQQNHNSDDDNWRSSVGSDNDENWRSSRMTRGVNNTTRVNNGRNNIAYGQGQYRNSQNSERATTSHGGDARDSSAGSENVDRTSGDWRVSGGTGLPRERSWRLNRDAHTGRHHAQHHPARFQRENFNRSPERDWNNWRSRQQRHTYRRTYNDSNSSNDDDNTMYHCNSSNKNYDHQTNRVPAIEQLSDDVLQAKLEPLAGPAFDDRTVCDDAVDPISQQCIWEEDENGERVANNTEITYLFSYKETGSNNHTFVRGFAIESFQQLLFEMKKKRSSSSSTTTTTPDNSGLQLKHPVSQAPIPSEAIENGEKMIQILQKCGKLEKPMDHNPVKWTLEEIKRTPGGMKKLAFAVFHLFYLKANIEIAEDSLLQLGIRELQGLAKTTRGLWLRNFNPHQRRQLSPQSNGQALHNVPPFWNGYNNVPAWQCFLLKSFYQIIGGDRVYNNPNPSTDAENGGESVEMQHLTKMAIFVVAAALATVCDEVRDRYSEGFVIDSPDQNQGGGVSMRW